MNKVLITLGLTIAASSSAFAANSADLNVAGKIAPGACDVTIDNSGAFDFGRIRAGDLYLDRETIFHINTNYGFSCASPTKLAFKLTDNRPAEGSTAVNCTAYAPVDNTTCNFGVGKFNGLSVGSYAIQLVTNRSLMPSYNSGIGWGFQSAGAVLSTAAWYAFWAAGSVPESVTSNTGQVKIILRINPIAQFSPVTSDIPIDGSATLELIYL